MLIRIWEFRDWTNQWLVTNEFYIPNESGTYGQHLSHINEMSDRCRGFDFADPRAWAYKLFLSVDVDFAVTVDNANNNISVNFNGFRGWQFNCEAGPTPPGYSVVMGNYQWYSMINGNEIYHYIGSPVSGQGGYTQAGVGGTINFNAGTIRAQQESERKIFSRIYNNVNGVQAYAYISFFNDLPPDYRPGERKVGGIWRSHNRLDGTAERKVGAWEQMRTIGGDTGATGDTPERKINGIWRNQSKLGEE